MRFQPSSANRFRSPCILGFPTSWGAGWFESLSHFTTMPNAIHSSSPGQKPVQRENRLSCAPPQPHDIRCLPHAEHLSTSHSALWGRPVLTLHSGQFLGLCKRSFRSNRPRISLTSVHGILHLRIPIAANTSMSNHWCYRTPGMCSMHHWSSSAFRTGDKLAHRCRHCSPKSSRKPRTVLEYLLKSLYCLP